MAVQVQITCATTGAEIHYTTDGTEPSESSSLYSGEFSVEPTGTLIEKCEIINR